MYAFVFGWVLPTFLPILFLVVVGSSLVVSHISKNHYYAVYAQIICIVYITSFIQWSIGGVFDSGFVMVWAFCGPIVALIFFPLRKSFAWLALYLASVLITVLFDSTFASHGYNVADTTRLVFFAMNLGVSSLVVFLFASGPLVAGVIGERKFQYNLFGDTVNTASRMESHGEVGHVQVSADTHALIQEEFDCVSRGVQTIKGKGEMETWFVVGRRLA